MTFFKIKKTPFHFLFVFIFSCMATTQPIVASSMESSKSLSKEGETVILGDNYVHFKKKKDVWRLMMCEDSSLCREVEMDDMDNIAHHLVNLRAPIEEYCQKEGEDDLCEWFALVQRKTGNVTLVSAEIGGAISGAFSSGLLLALGVVVILAVVLASFGSKNKKTTST